MPAVGRCLFLGVLLASCRAAEPVAPRATVHFVLDAPLCSSIIPVQFSIDGERVGVDTFVTIAGRMHTRSRGFATSAGRHTLGARAAHGYVWPERRVTLTAGQVYADSLPFYCSQ